jgi:hypothetical protein
MKKLMVLIIGFVITWNMNKAQEIKYEDQTKDINKITMYCATLIDGKMILMDQNQKPVKSEVTMANGIKITADAIVVKKDGSKTVLKNGECVDSKGNIEKVKVNRIDEKERIENK